MNETVVNPILQSHVEIEIFTFAKKLEAFFTSLTDEDVINILVIMSDKITRDLRELVIRISTRDAGAVWDFTYYMVANPASLFVMRELFSHL